MRTQLIPGSPHLLRACFLESLETRLLQCDEATAASASTERNEVEDLDTLLMNRTLVQIVKIGSIQLNGLHRINLIQ